MTPVKEKVFQMLQTLPDEKVVYLVKLWKVWED